MAPSLEPLLSDSFVYHQVSGEHALACVREGCDWYTQDPEKAEVVSDGYAHRKFHADLSNRVPED